MVTKTERIEARVEPAVAAMISTAAEIENEPKGAFVVVAAVSRAEEVLARIQATAVPDVYFEELLRALDEPEGVDNVGLRDLFHRTDGIVARAAEFYERFGFTRSPDPSRLTLKASDLQIHLRQVEK